MIFNIFCELDFVTEHYIYVGFFHVEAYSCLLLLFSLVDISWIFQCQLNLHHLSIKNILQMMLLTSKSHICGRSTGEIFQWISEKQLLHMSKLHFWKLSIHYLPKGVSLWVLSINDWPVLREPTGLLHNGDNFMKLSCMSA